MTRLSDDCPAPSGAGTAFARFRRDNDGGMAVPVEFVNEISKVVEGEDSILARCRQISISSNTVSIPQSEVTPWGSTGPQAYVVGEADAITQSKPRLTELRLILRKVACLVPSSEELLSDAPAMQSFIAREAADAGGRGGERHSQAALLPLREVQGPRSGAARGPQRRRSV